MLQWKQPVPDSIASVSIPSPSLVPVLGPVSITNQVLAADEVQVIDPATSFVYSASKATVHSAYYGEQATKYQFL